MSDEEKKIPNAWMRVATWGGIVLVIAVCVFFILGVRVVAKEEVSGSNGSQEQFFALINKSLSDVDFSFEPLGDVGEDLEEAARILSAPEQPFLIMDDFGGEFEVFSLNSLLEKGFLDDQEFDLLSDTIFSEIVEVIQPDWQLYEVFLNSERATIALNQDVSEASGIFASYSRIVVRPRERSRTVYQKDCSEPFTLTYYFWGAPAETISVCFEAQCKSGSPEKCEVFDTPKKSGWFANLSTNPSPSFPGQIRNDVCFARTQVSVQYLVGQVKLKVIEAELDQLFTRSLEATIDCSGKLDAVVE